MSQKKSIPVSALPLVWAEIDLSALRHNLGVIRAQLGSKPCEIMGVVKSDAYGHGMKPISRALFRKGVRFFGVATVDEALTLREILPRAQILLLGTFHRSQLPLLDKNRVTLTLSGLEDLQLLEAYLAKRSRAGIWPVHVKVDTGMGRLGVWYEEIELFFRALRDHRRVQMQGLYTHLAHADANDLSRTREQLKLFNRAAALAAERGLRPKYLHAANSMGILRCKGAHFNLVRPGLALYGIASGKLQARLRPVLSLKTRIAFLKDMKPGYTLSYGGTYETPANTVIGTLPIGYGHGYRVALSNKAFVIIAGKKYPVVGRITMDQMLVDLGDAKGIRRWDPVTVIGSERRVSASAQELAGLAGTIPYEILCALHSKIPRFYR